MRLENSANPLQDKLRYLADRLGSKANIVVLLQGDGRTPAGDVCFFLQDDHFQISITDFEAIAAQSPSNFDEEVTKIAKRRPRMH